MKSSNLIIAIFVVLILSVLAYFKLTEKVESSLAVEDMPVDSKEFVWVRMDSLSRGLMDISGTEIKVDSMRSKSYVITYTSKKYLLHEVIEGIETNIDFIYKILENDNFMKNNYDTSFISKEFNL